MKYFEGGQLLLEETCKKYVSYLDFSFNFITSVTIFKLVAGVLLIYGEYSYLTWPICQNETQQFALLYPYAAFAGIILLALTQFYLSECDISACIRIELISNFLLGIVMFWVSWLSLRFCLRPSGFVYFLPEIYGPFVPLVLFTHTSIWYYTQSCNRVP